MLKKYFLVHLADFITNFQKCLRFHWNIKLGLNFKKISLDREFMQHQSYSGNNILQNTSKLNAIWKNNHIYLLYTNILEPLVRWSKNVKIIAITTKSFWPTCSLNIKHFIIFIDAQTCKEHIKIMKPTYF